jgi:endonuclease/exonuclease/phosphatase family metal-dependent hydrolase
VATGSGPLSYQWQFGTTILPGATNATFTINHVEASEAGQYSVTVSNAGGSTSSAAATLTVIAPSTNGLLTLVTYNVKGNFAADWSTNAPQVQAIARELQYLDPDIITLNEIPNGLRYEMTNWMTAFFPTHSLAVSSGTDGSIRSGVISRYPIARSQSWLDGASLTNFGYNGTFTRDLFEAEIPVPGAAEPVHVFTTHLKSGSDGDSQDRRAAEASAVSNFLATVFIPAHGARPYVLTGDLNEDIDQPYSHNDQPLQRLLGASTGLRYTTPVNPFTLSPLTHSIQSTNGLDKRFDYIFPAGVLASNILASQVFRTDLLPSPPPPLLADDDATASDHLPVVMVFNYPDPPLQVGLTLSNAALVLRWPALIGRNYQVEASGDLVNWTVADSNLVALTSPQTWSTSATATSRFYRVVRVP